MSNEKDVLLSLTAKMLNKTDAELAELLYMKEGDKIELKEDAAEILINADVERIGRAKEESTSKFNEGHSKGKKESLGKLEKDFKEKTGFESDLTGVDLITAWGESLKEKGGITDDDIKSHPLYIALEKTQVPKEEYDELTTAFDVYKKEQAKAAVLKTVKERAWDLTVKRNPNLEENTAIAEKRKVNFLSEFDKFEYDVISGGVVVKQGGKRLETKHGALIGFDSFVDGIADGNFTFSVQDPKGNAGNRNKAGGASSIPQNEKEYVQMVNNAKTPEEMIAIKKAWESRK